MYPEDAARVRVGEVVYGWLEEPYVVLSKRREAPKQRGQPPSWWLYIRPDHGPEGWRHARVLRRAGGGFGYAGDPERAAANRASTAAIFKATEARYGPGRRPPSEDKEAS